MSVTHRVFKAFVTISVGGKEAAMAAEEEMSKALSQQRRYRTRGSMRAHELHWRPADGEEDLYFVVYCRPADRW
jgi:hypothetical protein